MGWKKLVIQHTPPPKTNMVHLKMGAPWKRRFLLETIISRFHVNFWGCSDDEYLSYSYTGLKGSFGSSCSRCSILLSANRFNATMGQCHSPSPKKKQGRGFIPRTPLKTPENSHNPYTFDGFVVHEKNTVEFVYQVIQAVTFVSRIIGGHQQPLEGSLN